MRVMYLHRKACAVEAEFLGLVNAEGRTAEDRNKEVYGTVILLQLTLLQQRRRRIFPFNAPAQMRSHELCARKQPNEEVFREASGY